MTRRSRLKFGILPDNKDSEPSHKPSTEDAMEPSSSTISAVGNLLKMLKNGTKNSSIMQTKTLSRY